MGTTIDKGVNWRDEAERINEALHRLIGVEPCATACTHHLTGTWTMAGVANVAARNGTVETGSTSIGTVQ
jgi:hypothetical protein